MSDTPQLSEIEYAYTPAGDPISVETLWKTRNMLMLLLLHIYGPYTAFDGYDIGWSRRQHNGELVFEGRMIVAWIGLPTGQLIHMYMNDDILPPACFERPTGVLISGPNTSLEGLAELVRMITEITDL